MNKKASIRKQKKSERDSISLEEKNCLKKQLTESFIKATSFFELYNVGLYFSVHNEIPTDEIIDHIEGKGIGCYLPIIPEDSKQKAMRFSRYKKGDKLKKNKFGIPEPSYSSFLELHSIDLFLLPLLAFDKKGFRVGMGMGYYDSTFLNKKTSSSCKVWGLAYEFQEEKTCYPEPHDLKLDAVLCPDGLRKF